MRDPAVFDAMNDSQDGRPLASRRDKVTNRIPMYVWPELGDGLSDLVIGLYLHAEDREELITHLRYCVRELQAAVDVVRKLEEVEHA
jgi:hypothetical protein